MDWSVPLRIFLLIFVNTAYSQDISPECPSPWIAEGDNCYLFSEDILPWLDARIACERYGANLVSVNSDIENDFLNNWFLVNNNVPGSRSRWYTSAFVVSGQGSRSPTWQWLDGTAFGSNAYWVDEAEPRDGVGDHIIYQYSDTGEQQRQPGFFWYRNPGTIPFRYICEIAKRDAAGITSKARDFTFGVSDVDALNRGPYFLQQPEDVPFQVSVDAKKDSQDCAPNCRSASFDCEASGYPQPTYRWYERTLAGTKELSAASTGKITITNGRLTVHNPVRTEDTSLFWCVATNKFGSIKSTAASISYIVLEEFPKNPKTINARQYESAVIPCTHPKQNGVQYSYFWFINGNPTDFVTAVYNNHMFVSRSGGLYFSAVFSSDSNSYSCSVSVEGGSEQRASPLYPLEIDTSQSYKPIGPIIRDDFPKIIPENPMKGDKVVLECLARFARREGEAAIYQWTRENDAPLPRGHELIDYNRKLILHNVQPADEGTYFCRVSYQQSSNRKSIVLSVSAAPFFSEGGLRDQHQDKGARFTWSCLANGDPAPKYYWLKNANPFDSQNMPPDGIGRITFSANNQSVTFAELNSDTDPGMYQCVASNTHGTAFSNAQLRVLEFAPTFDKHPMLGRILATEEGNATIPCDPEAAPQATISWLKDGQPYQVSQDSSSAKRLLPNNHLFLSGIERSIDEGVYTCVARNSVPNPDTGEDFSEAQASIELVVVQRSRLSIGPLDKKVELGSEITLQCRADFNPILDLVYLWYHNDRLIDFDDWKMSNMFRRGEGVSRGDLIIPQTTYEERGQYKCVGQTRSDDARLTATVDVYGPPGEPAGVKASNPTKHTVFLQWIKGAENGGPITGYIIERYNIYTRDWVLAKNVTSPGEIATGNATVRDLFANTGYKFRVKALNTYGVGKPSMESDIVTTAKDLPTSYPKNIGGGGGKEGTLVIRWDPLPREQWNADNLEYFAEYREYDGQETGGSYSKCNDNKPIPHGSSKSGICVVTVGVQKFYTKYYVRVWARNSLGNGPIPAPVIAYSAVRIPSVTPQKTLCQPFNSTSLIAYWLPVPDDRNSTGGQLSGFHIQYWVDGTPREFGRRVTIPENVTEGAIIGLQPNTDYRVAVQLYNSAGDGRPGEDIMQTTWMKAPQNMPEYVTLNKTGDTTLGVHFRGVVTQPDEEPLDGYKVRIWRVGESLTNAKDYDCGRRTWIYINDGFEKNDIYNLRVFGYSRGGVGKMSSPLIQFTLGCNKSPTNPEARWVYLCGSSTQSTISFILALAVILFHIMK